MANEVAWIKLTTDMFDNRKIKHLRRLPDGNNIVLIWVMLLTMAGRCNSGGMIFLTENIPYTPKMLADELDFEENTVQLALTALEQLNMIVMDHGFFSIAGWEEHQNIDGLEKIREQNRLRKQRQREKQKLLPDVSRDSHGTVTQSHSTEEDIEEDKEIEEEKDEKNTRIDCQQVVDLYHSICKSFPSVRSLSDARKKAIKARLKTYAMDDFKTVFENAEASSFLKGVDGGWKASFDWLIKEANMLKVLEGNYADKPKRYGRKEPVPGWMGKRETDDDEIAAVRRMFADENSVTVGNNPELADRAERLRQELQR